MKQIGRMAVQVSVQLEAMLNFEKSTRTKLSCLRNILLKSSAINFEKIFLGTDHVQEKVVKKDIKLPPKLFEDIQLMGSQIGWPIASRFLKPCLVSRDALNWANVDLLLGHFEVKDLVRVQEARLPIKQFSFRVNRMTPDLICLIRKLAPTLEILHVGIFDEIEADLTSLIIIHSHLAIMEKTLVKLMNSFPFLENFILNYSTSLKVDIEIVKSKNLKYLGYFIPMEEYRKPDYYEIPDIENFAQKVGSSFNAESLLTSYEHFAFAELFTTTPVDDIIARLIINGPNYLTTKHWQKIEKVVLIFVERFWMDWGEDLFLYANKIIKLGELNNHIWTTEFMARLANLTVNFSFYIQKDIEIRNANFIWDIELMKSRQIMNFMLEHVTRNPDTNISRMYLNYFLLSNMYYHKDIDKKTFIDISTDVEVSFMQCSGIQQNHAV